MASPGYEPFAGEVPALTQQVEPDNCIKILLATDNHIGYAENDPVRGRDSINSFREILQLAKENEVDLLLLAGDLFHENRPSRTALYQTISALREFTHGSQPIRLEIISEAGVGIQRDATWPPINYEDENINVGLPIFSIHGNHDDPQGTGAEGALCALDLLSASGLINYFGRLELPGSADNDEDALESGLQVKPVLLQKGETKLALYGMGNIRDERFHYEMKNHRIQMFKPAEDPQDWFNIILVHQNRVAHGPGRNITDTAFGDEAHLIVWGHEHDCIEKATPQPVTGRPYYIVQPGSSIATSLAKGEAVPKHVSLIKIQGKEFEFEPIRLKSVRPFLFEEVSLANCHDPENKINLNTKVSVNKFLKKKVNEMIEKANKEWDELHEDDEKDDEDEDDDEEGGGEGKSKQERLLPLIRLRVDYSYGPEGDSLFEVGNPQRFGQDFVDRVANPRDIVQFHRKAAAASKKIKMDAPLQEDLDAIIEEGVDVTERMAKLKVSGLVSTFLKAQNLGVLPEGAMQDAVEEFVEKGDKDAIANLLKKCLKHSLSSISANFQPSKAGPEHDDLEQEMEQAKKSAQERYGKKKKGKDVMDEDSEEEEEEEEEEEDDRDSMASSGSSSRGKKGKGKAKAAPVKKKAPAKKPTTKGKGKGKAKDLFNDDSDEEEEEEEESLASEISSEEEEVKPKKKAPTKKAPAAAAVPVKKTPAPRAKKTTTTTTKKKKEAEVLDLMSSSEEEDMMPSKKKKRT